MIDEYEAMLGFLAEGIDSLPRVDVVPILLDVCEKRPELPTAVAFLGERTPRTVKSARPLTDADTILKMIIVTKGPGLSNDDVTAFRFVAATAK